MLRNRWVTHSLLITFLMVVLLVFGESTLLASAIQEETDAPKHITLTWTGDTRTTQTITWQTGSGGSNGQLQYAEKTTGAFPKNAVQIGEQPEILSTDVGNIGIHSVTLTGLKPGTSYLYRVGNGTAWSEPFSFTTSSESVSKFKFLIFGDSQSDCYDLWHDVLQQAYKANQNAAFLTVVGDLVDVGSEYAQWDAWFDAAQSVISTIPVMPMTGNHEYYTPVWGERSMPEMFTAQIKLPGNGPEGLEGHVYSFDYENTHFVMLDSQEREAAQLIPDMLEKQKAWLEQDLANTDKKWKIVFFHKPPYHSKTSRANDAVREAFVPVFDQYHVDVVFNGHEHVYARTYPLCHDTVVDSASEGTVYITTGRSGTKAHHNMEANDWHEAFYNPEDEPNYLVVEVDGDHLKINAFKQSGSQVDSFYIDKTN